MQGIRYNTRGLIVCVEAGEVAFVMGSVSLCASGAGWEPVTGDASSSGSSELCSGSGPDMAHLAPLTVHAFADLALLWPSYMHLQAYCIGWDCPSCIHLQI